MSCQSGRTSGCCGVLETWGAVLPSSSSLCACSQLSCPGCVSQIQLVQVKGNREGPAHLLTMCPCVLPQGFQKDDQQDKMNWGGG